jgi:hypothetical protein
MACEQLLQTNSTWLGHYDHTREMSSTLGRITPCAVFLEANATARSVPPRAMDSLVAERATIEREAPPTRGKRADVPASSFQLPR